MQTELGLADLHTHSHTAESSLCIWAHTETFCTNSIEEFTALPEVFRSFHLFFFFFVAFSNET